MKTIDLAEEIRRLSVDERHSLIEEIGRHRRRHRPNVAPECAGAEDRPAHCVLSTRSSRVIPRRVFEQLRNVRVSRRMVFLRSHEDITRPPSGTGGSADLAREFTQAVKVATKNIARNRFDFLLQGEAALVMDHSLQHHLPRDRRGSRDPLVFFTSVAIPRVDARS